jgi:anti-sigma factor RsiW
MNCEGFDRRLDALVDGRCTADEWREAEAHLAACARCSRLFEAMAGRADDLDDAGHASLTEAVIARTAGSACPAARERLCDFADGSLSPFDRALVDAHLAGCRPCAELARTLAWSARVLPSFAELPVPDGFVRTVLSATSRRVTGPSFADRVASWLGQVARRPRFSLEVAYVCTALLLLVLGDPVKAFRDASVRVQPRVETAAAAIGRPLATARGVGTGTLSRVERLVRPVATDRTAGTTGGTAWSLSAWWQANVERPLRAMVGQLSGWAREAFDAANRLLQQLRKDAAGGRAAASPSAAPTEPGGRAVRLS